jgi:hypothetical protein
MPVGTIAGELYAGAALSPAARSRIVLPLAGAGLLPLLLYPFHPGLGWILLVLVLAGSAGAYTLGLDRWFVDAVPEELRGRAMTVHTAGLMTIQGVGMALAGAAAEFWAVSTVVGGVGVLGTVCCVLLAVEVRRTGGAGEAEGKGAAEWPGKGPGRRPGKALEKGANIDTRDGADHDMTGR